jgi:hypothetical protein
VDIRPSGRGPARLWQHAESGLIAIGMWSERIPGRGEDAEPLVLFHRPTGRGLLAVFDGVGGAGRSTAGRTRDGAERTQAWVASRRVRGLVEEWFVNPAGEPTPAAHIAARLGGGVSRTGRIRGRIHREFPTTFAGLSFEVTDRQVRWDVLWAGDSRCYVAEPSWGLQQLSRDDTEPSDALDLLVQDPPMTNLICVGADFGINRWRDSADLPCLLVCATDGCFGYVDTPAQFEHLLLETLLSAQDARHWAALLAERIGAVTGDDASLAVLALGLSDFGALKANFHERLELLRVQHAQPMRAALGAERSAFAVARERSWLAYRGAYERRLPRAEGDLA